MSYVNGFMPSNNYNGMMNNGYQQPMSYDNRMQQLNSYMEQLKGGSMNMNQQPQVQVPQQSSNMNFIKVANMQQAKEWVVQNNQEVWMQDSSEPYLYYKSVDNLGSANFRILKVDDVTDQMLNGSNQAPMTEVNLDKYVPIENFNELRNQVNALTNKVNNYESLFGSMLNPQPQVTQGNVVEQQKTVGRPKANSVPKEANK